LANTQQIAKCARTASGHVVFDFGGGNTILVVRGGVSAILGGNITIFSVPPPKLFELLQRVAVQSNCQNSTEIMMVWAQTTRAKYKRNF